MDCEYRPIGIVSRPFDTDRAYSPVHLQVGYRRWTSIARAVLDDARLNSNLERRVKWVLRRNDELHMI